MRGGVRLASGATPRPVLAIISRHLKITSVSSLELILRSVLEV